MTSYFTKKWENWWHHKADVIRNALSLKAQRTPTDSRTSHMLYWTHKFKRSVFCCTNGCQAATLENNLPGISSAALFCFLSHAHFVLITACKVKLYIASWTNHRPSFFPPLSLFSSILLFSIYLFGTGFKWCQVQCTLVSSKHSECHPKTQGALWV